MPGIGCFQDQATSSAYHSIPFLLFVCPSTHSRAHLSSPLQRNTTQSITTSFFTTPSIGKWHWFLQSSISLLPPVTNIHLLHIYSFRHLKEPTHSLWFRVPTTVILLLYNPNHTMIPSDIIKIYCSTVSTCFSHPIWHHTTVPIGPLSPVLSSAT